MSLIYLVALIAVLLALIGALADAVWSVSRKPAWGHPRHSLNLVTTQERRSQSLPFIGAERRQGTATDPQTEIDEVAA